jgi:acetate kinase
LIDGIPVVGVGHRVVHGGMRYAAPVRVDGKVLATLETLTPLAPLHQPHNLAPILAILEAAPQMPQVACFDTAFHRTQENLAQLFALPRKFTEAGIRRYGFHGLSYEYVVSRLSEIAPELLDARLIVAHLGNGASLCAVHQGRSVASTMGFTAVDGLMMGTRCGSLDPGVILYLMDACGMDARAIENLVYRQSGLLGVSGISSDMRTLRASSDPAAAEAIALFNYRIVREIGSLAAALDGVDALIFTGGIGENDAETRAAVSEGCRWLGLQLDDTRNKGDESRISTDTSRMSAWVVPTDEELMVARHTAGVLGLIDM